MNPMWLPYGSYVGTIWLPCGPHLGPMWVSYGAHMNYMWKCMISIAWISCGYSYKTNHVETRYMGPRRFLYGIAWISYGYHVEIIWIIYGNHNANNHVIVI